MQKLGAISGFDRLLGVNPDSGYILSDVESNRLPSMDSSQDVNQSLGNDSALSDSERLDFISVQDCGSSLVNLDHFDPLVLDARIVESGSDKLESIGRSNGFSCSVHDWYPPAAYPVIHLYDPQAQPMYFTG